MTNTNAETQAPLFLADKPAMRAKKWGGHQVRSAPEEGDEGGDAGELLPGREERFTGICLVPQEFDQLVGPLAYRSFFNEGTQPPEPAFSSFSKIKLDTVYKNCWACIVFGVSNATIELENVTIKNITVEPVVGGVAEMSLTIVAIFPRTLEVLDLESMAGKPITLSLCFGPKPEVAGDPQQQLPMDPDGVTRDGTPIERTRVLAPGQAEAEAETDRQLREALRGLDRQQTDQVEGGAAANEGGESSDEAA